jgi:hypothetical protein
VGRLFSRAADCAIYINGKTVQSRPPLLVRQCSRHFILSQSEQP